MGDLLLAEVATRLKSCVRQIDTVARFGGDEFVVLLDELAADKDHAHVQADLVVKKIRTVLASPYVFHLAAGDSGEPHAIEHRCTGSIGVTIFLGVEKTGEEVLKRADLAMYEAKNSGRNAVRFCQNESDISHLANQNSVTAKGR